MTTAEQAEAKEAEQAKKPADELNVEAVFAKLKQLGGGSRRTRASSGRARYSFTGTV